MIEKTSTSPVDIEFFQRELESFLPDCIYDAHTHLWKSDLINWTLPGVEGDCGYAEYQRCMEDIHPGRTTHALFIPFITTEHREQSLVANQWIAEQLTHDPKSRGLFFVKPEDDPEWIREQVRELGLHGLKCYHTMAATDPTWNADIDAFLPESFVQVAHEESLAITLHIVKARALGDSANREWIRRTCQKYPDMKLILAHSGRAFQPAHNLEGLPDLVGLDNLYFDTSANCEPIAHQAIIRILGHDRLMYGSDLPISHMRGRSLSAADTFIWLYENTPVWGENHAQINPVLIGLEHLRSLKWACWSEKLTDSQVEDVFYHNAAKLLGVGETTPTDLSVN